MKKEYKKQLKLIRQNNSTYFKTLKPTGKEHTFIATIEFSGYMDLMDTVKILIDLVIGEIYYGASGASSQVKVNPNLQSILELIVQLLPLYESELLDELRPILTPKEKPQKEVSPPYL